jgi:predicted Fe-Mo cluster-binding NifX family protein
MKIAIPTEDGFTVNQHFTPAKGFLVSTIQFGTVIQQEMRWNSQGNVLKSVEGSYTNLADCDTVIVREIDQVQSNYLQLQKKEVIISKETLIINSIQEYVQDVMMKKSNTTCAP